MGKAKNKRTRPPKFDPTGRTGPNNEGVGDDGAGDRKADKIAAVVEQLKSASAEERLCGCHTFAQLVSHDLTLDALRRHRLVRVAGPLLVDASADVRQAAAGALRNVSLMAAKEGCEVMLEQDILTSLLTALGKCSGGWKPGRRVEGGQVLLDSDSNVFIQLVNLLWNLCEVSEKAVASFNKSGVCAVLLQCLDRSVYPAEVLIAACQCLHMLSEDNETVAEAVREQAALVRALMTSDEESADAVLLRILALGILINVSADGSDLGPGQVVTLVTRTLTWDARELASNVTSDEDTADYEVQLTDVERLLTAQRVALEILTDFCGDDDSEGSWADQDSIDDEEVEEDDVPQADGLMEDVELAPNELDGTALPAELHEAIVGQKLLQKMLEKANMPPVNVVHILNDSDAGKQVLSRFRTLRCHVFLCLNNLTSALELSDLGGDSELHTLWKQMAQLVFQDKEADSELAEAAGGAMRAVLQKLLDSGRPGPADLTSADLRLMTDRLGDWPGLAPEARAGLLRGLALLACLRVARQEQLSAEDTQVVQAVGQFLLGAAAVPDAAPLVLAEALDALMDLFSEDCTDRVAADIHLVPKLRALQPTLKAKMSGQRGRLAQHYPLVATVRTNLPRFIKYKAGRVSALSAVQQHVNGNGVVK